MSNTNKHILSIMSCIVFALFFIASSTQKKVTTPVKVAAYDFSPPSQSAAKSSDIAFLVLNPSYVRQFQYSSVDMFYKFSTSMGPDFNELLIAKGYSVRGPFDNYDAIVYSDKKESDLILEIQIDLSVDDKNVEWKYKTGGYPIQAYYQCEGTMILSGKVNLTASEPLTKEKLWAKSIPLAQKSIVIAGEYNYDLPRNYTLVFSRDPGVINPLTTQLEDFYKSVMSTAWNQLDPRELTTLKKQVMEIRAKKEY
ncbi:MAG TPA: hypothetical protein PKN75_14540 [Bacteroidia bacterium]|nr:hypothetical protein [Bacteroidia bacterium]HNU34803.1 hypothetical protein [Bacteroidia bacterium]